MTSCIIAYSQLFLTAVIGGLTVFIACQQWRTNHNKLRLDLFDRRMAVFNDLEQFIDLIKQNVTTPDEAWVYFNRRLSERRFLFGKDIQKYAEEVIAKAIRYKMIKIEMEPLAANTPERSALAAEWVVLANWFGAQCLGGCADVFSRYFRFAQKK